MPLVFDVEQQYPAEYEVGLHLCKRMSREFGLSIPQREAAGIALCFVNNMDCGAEGDGDLADDSQLSFDELLERSVCVIEKGFGIDLDRSSFNFSRSQHICSISICVLLGASRLQVRMLLCIPCLPESIPMHPISPILLPRSFLMVCPRAIGRGAVVSHHAYKPIVREGSD